MLYPQTTKHNTFFISLHTCTKYFVNVLCDVITIPYIILVILSMLLLTIIMCDNKIYTIVCNAVYMHISFARHLTLMYTFNFYSE